MKKKHVCAFAQNSCSEYPPLWESLGRVVGYPSRESIVLLGDLNAELGNNSLMWSGLTGRNMDLSCKTYEPTTACELPTCSCIKKPVSVRGTRSAKAADQSLILEFCQLIGDQMFCTLEQREEQSCQWTTTCVSGCCPNLSDTFCANFLLCA